MRPKWLIRIEKWTNRKPKQQSIMYINPHSVVIMRTDQTDFTDLVNLCFE